MRTISRRLAAIMFTDIVGYTAMMQNDEAAGAAIRSRHREVFDREHERCHGEVLQYFGDGTLSVFQSGVEAVECAMAIQQALRSGEAVPLRIGLHIGDIVFDGTDIYGDGVNLASRIETLGVGGAILLSESLNRQLKSHPGIKSRSLGLFALKNIAEPVEVYAITNEGIYVPSRNELRGKQKQQTKSLAVLPFVNRSPDPDSEYFSDGMTEEIINALSGITELKVTSRTSSFFFKNKNIPIPQIGRELNVAAILEGSIRLYGDKMRLSARLIDVAEDSPFWSETFDRSVDDLFAVQDEISLLIASKLREQLGNLEVEDSLVEAPKVSVDTYKQYLKARYLLLRMSPSSLEEGLTILSGIIEEEPGYARAYLGMHMAYTLLATMGFMPAGEAFAKGKPHLEKAIELDSDIPDCQLQLAWDSFLQERDLAKAYAHLNRAMKNRPIVDLYQTMSSILVAEGKGEAALHYLETAFQLDPFSEINFHLKGFILYTQEKFEKAIQNFDRSIQLRANFSISTLYKGQALLCLGRADEALAFFQGLPEDEAGDILKLGGTTLSHAALKNIPKAEAGIARLEAFRDTELRERAMNLLILAYTYLGRKDAALQVIEEGLELRLPMMVYLPCDPLLKSLRPLDRFQDQMRSILSQEPPFLEGKRKYKNTLFNEQELEEYKSRLTDLMQHEEPYLDPDLSLGTLAENLGIPPNHLSQLLNEGYGKNFAEYINTYRLGAFKSRVADPGMRHMTLLALAYESGFSSKTVFNTFFKKVMGKTPKAYWKEVVQE